MRKVAADKAEEAASARARAAAENRARMPNVSAFVDEVRAVSPDAKVVWAKEGGYEIGKKPDRGISMAETSISGKCHKRK